MPWIYSPVVPCSTQQLLKPHLLYPQMDSPEKTYFAHERISQSSVFDDNLRHLNSWVCFIFLCHSRGPDPTKFREIYANLSTWVAENQDPHFGWHRRVHRGGPPAIFSKTHFLNRFRINPGPLPDQIGGQIGTRTPGNWGVSGVTPSYQVVLPRTPGNSWCPPGNTG